MESDEHQTAENLPTNDVCSLTPVQKERIERNRLKAISLKRSRIEQRAAGMGNEKKLKQTVEVDSHGGYFIEDDDKSTETLLANRESTMDDKVVENDELLECEKCHQSFFHSFLWTSFRCSICDACRDPKGEHKLITKTEAKDIFLLQDCDFEERGGPPLLFILKKNPHNSRGEMKLYLISQIMSRSYALWNGEEGLEEERSKRQHAREERRQKQYSKKIKSLRSSVYTSSRSTSHTHVYPKESEMFDPQTDLWTKTCQECGYSVTFEKL